MTPRASASSTHKTVLVVDDDEQMRELFATTLRFEGFEVWLAVDGIAALRQIDEHRPDVILLDLDLPKVSGIGLHAELESRLSTRAIPVVIVTGTEWDSPFRPFAVLRKPVTPDELVDVVSQAAALAR